LFFHYSISPFQAKINIFALLFIYILSFAYEVKFWQRCKQEFSLFTFGSTQSRKHFTILSRELINSVS